MPHCSSRVAETPRRAQCQRALGLRLGTAPLDAWPGWGLHVLLPAPGALGGSDRVGLCQGRAGVLPGGGRPCDREASCARLITEAQQTHAGSGGGWEGLPTGMLRLILLLHEKRSTVDYRGLGSLHDLRAGPGAWLQSWRSDPGRPPPAGRWR